MATSCILVQVYIISFRCIRFYTTVDGSTRGYRRGQSSVRKAMLGDDGETRRNGAKLGVHKATTTIDEGKQHK